ncbi:MAG: aminoacyl-tRNA hydrolase [Chitinophagales bacterium]|nr:aminoacyl-tRNA hydrolase [Chitinophagales bacterium]
MSTTPSISRLSEAALLRELSYRTSRSGGKGGQNVNKVETKVEVRLNIAASAVLSEAQKALILEKLSGQLNSEGEFIVTNQTERSQLGNKAKAETKLLNILRKALHRPKKRKPTIVPVSVQEARSRAKRKRAEIKQSRQGKWEE